MAKIYKSAAIHRKTILRVLKSIDYASAWMFKEGVTRDDMSHTEYVDLIRQVDAMQKKQIKHVLK